MVQRLGISIVLAGVVTATFQQSGLVAGALHLLFFCILIRLWGEYVDGK